MDWNYTAVGDLLTFDHTLDDDTLTESIPYSVPIIQEAPGDLTELTVSILEESLDNPVDVVLSASSGFDTRLLLAALLHLGIKPRLLVCGPRGNFDRDVVEEIGKRLSLEVIPVELCAQDCVDHAERIVALTGGTKTARHWHTFLYPLKAGLDPGCRIVVGANGESMRSFYFDRGLLAHATRGLPRTPLLKKFWSVKARTRFLADQLSGLSDPLRENLCGPGWRRRLDRLVAASRGRDFMSSLDHFYYHQRVKNFIGNGLKVYGQFGRVVAPMTDTRWVAVAKSNLCGPGWRRRLDRLVAASRGRDFMSSLDHFYYHQRVKNFIGNGLKVYGQFGRVVAPMTDTRWVAVAKSMPRSSKLDSRWHREAINELCPELLSFPEQATGRPMAANPGALYWTKKRRRERRRRGGPPYADYADWFASAIFRDMIMDRREAMSELMSSELLDSVMASGSVPLISQIASLAVFASLDRS